MITWGPCFFSGWLSGASFGKYRRQSSCQAYYSILKVQEFWKFELSPMITLGPCFFSGWLSGAIYGKFWRWSSCQAYYSILKVQEFWKFELSPMITLGPLFFSVVDSVEPAMGCQKPKFLPSLLFHFESSGIWKLEHSPMITWGPCFFSGWLSGASYGKYRRQSSCQAYIPFWKICFFEILNFHSWINLRVLFFQWLTQWTQLWKVLMVRSTSVCMYLL